MGCRQPNASHPGSSVAALAGTVPPSAAIPNDPTTAAAIRSVLRRLAFIMRIPAPSLALDMVVCTIAEAWRAP
jgi:hypothetical protein